MEEQTLVVCALYCLLRLNFIAVAAAAADVALLIHVAVPFVVCKNPGTMTNFMDNEIAFSTSCHHQTKNNYKKFETGTKIAIRVLFSHELAYCALLVSL